MGIILLFNKVWVKILTVHAEKVALWATQETVRRTVFLSSCAICAPGISPSAEGDSRSAAP